MTDITQLYCSSNLAGIMANKIKRSRHLFCLFIFQIESIERALEKRGGRPRANTSILWLHRHDMSIRIKNGSATSLQKQTSHLLRGGAPWKILASRLLNLDQSDAQ